MLKIAIIGGGLTGLTIAKQLECKAQVTVFEKSRGVSGRMSTRRAEPYWFDHGAQYFTARHIEFKEFLQPFIQQGVVQPWRAKYALLDRERLISMQDLSASEPRYVGVPGMNVIAKMLAESLSVQLNTRIIRLERRAKQWTLIDSENQVYGEFDWVVVATPAPQAASLLPSDFKYFDVVSKAKMQACFSLMLGFKHPLNIFFDAARVHNSDVSWLAVNSSKPGREGLFCVLAHSSQEYAQAHIDSDRQAVQEHLCAEVAAIIPQMNDSQAEYQTLHGWRYAHCSRRIQSLALLDETLQLAACGDWCLEGRVEGAFMAALELVRACRF